MFFLFRLSLVCALIYWAYLFIATPGAITDVAREVAEVLPSRQSVAAAVRDTLPPPKAVGRAVRETLRPARQDREP